jgi:hypothetical protein
MTDNELDILDQLFDEDNIVKILKQNKPIDRAILVRYLHQSGGEAIPKKVIDYACSVIEGKVKPRRGRKPTSPSLKLCRIFRYSENLRWLQRRAGMYGRLPRFGGRQKRAKIDERAPLHELAATLIPKQQRRFGKTTTLDPRVIMNMASAFWKQGRIAQQKPAAARARSSSQKST